MIFLFAKNWKRCSAFGTLRLPTARAVTINSPAYRLAASLTRGARGAVSHLDMRTCPQFPRWQVAAVPFGPQCKTYEKYIFILKGEFSL